MNADELSKKVLATAEELAPSAAFVWILAMDGSQSSDMLLGLVKK